MRCLDKNWLTEGLIDLEYKKYIMMSYLQYVESRFSVKMVYPVLDELLEHFKNLKKIEKEKQLFDNSFPKRISKIDLKRRKFDYTKLIPDQEWVLYLDEILDFALDSFSRHIKIGNEIVEQIISKIQLDPVGIIPLYKKEGYLLISFSRNKTICIYKFRVSPIQGLDEEQQIKFKLVGKESVALTTTYKQIKNKILQSNKDYPNPATYGMYCEEKLPINAALLPIAKRLLKHQLAA